MLIEGSIIIKCTSSEMFVCLELCQPPGFSSILHICKHCSEFDSGSDYYSVIGNH